MDNEVMGVGNMYDYGFRIYNPRTGKFLSVDPLTSSYPWNSTFAFAENRVLDGIDLDGLEYLDSDYSRIEINSGKVQLKLENFFRVNRSAYNAANNNPNNWGGEQIGINKTVATLKFKEKGISQTSSIVNLPFITEQLEKNRDGLRPARIARSASTHPSEQGVEYIKSLEGNQSPSIPNRVLRSRPIGGPKTPRGIGLPGLTLALNALTFSFEQYAIFTAWYDKEKTESDILKLNSAISDVNTALNIDGFIPDSYRNVEDLSDITNVVLQGVNPTDNQEIYDIGIKIVKEISGNYQGSKGGVDSIEKPLTPTDNTRVVNPLPIIK